MVKPRKGAEPKGARAKLLDLTDPEGAAYVEALKQEFQQYAMTPDQARRIVDDAMGATSLTDLLADVRRERS